MNMFTSLAKKIFFYLGYIVSRYDKRKDPKVVLGKFFEKNSIDVVLDVGANAGQYAHQLRKDGFKGKIVSFEPLSSAFKALELKAKGDAQWEVRNCALGEKVETLEINIAGNSWSSSLLDMMPSHTNEAPESTYIDKENVQVETLDGVYAKYIKPANNVFLKIDTQGYTKQVLDGALESIKDIKGVMLEMSLVELYEGEPLIGDAITIMYDMGFTLVYRT